MSPTRTPKSLELQPRPAGCLRHAERAAVVLADARHRKICRNATGPQDPIDEGVAVGAWPHQVAVAMWIGRCLLTDTFDHALGLFPGEGGVDAHVPTAAAVVVERVRVGPAFHGVETARWIAGAAHHLPPLPRAVVSKRDPGVPRDIVDRCAQRCAPNDHGWTATRWRDDLLAKDGAARRAGTDREEAGEGTDDRGPERTHHASVAGFERWPPEALSTRDRRRRRSTHPAHHRGRTCTRWGSCSA